MNLLQLKRIALTARTALEKNSLSNTDVVFQSFPHGACGVTADLLGRYLLEIMHWPVQYISAERADGKTHAWNTVGGIIIDITADQFGQMPVIVTNESHWHNEWEAEKPREPICSPENWPTYPHATWHALIDGLKAEELPVPMIHA